MRSTANSDSDFLERDRTELATEQRQSVFPDARVGCLNSFTTPQGNNVHAVYVDLSGKVETKGLCLVKATEPQYDLATASTIRLSFPKEFRHTGEVLIQDEQEGRAQTSTSESGDLPSTEPELVSERMSALNAALQLGRTKMSVSGSDKRKQSNTSGAAVTFGEGLPDLLHVDAAFEGTKRRRGGGRCQTAIPVSRPSIVRPSSPKGWGSACAHTSAFAERRVRCKRHSADS